MLRCKNFVFNSFAENTYILWDQNSGEAAIIDPGCSDEDEELRITEYIEKNNIQLKYLINTHCHIDHIFGNNFVKERYDPVFYAPEEDLFLLKNLKQQAAIFGISATPSPMPDAFITEELNIKLGEETGTFYFTPGHTPGEYCLYFPESAYCFTGDVLFREGVGRTDLWGGDFDTLMNSITGRLFKLPHDTVILPGHGEKSTIGHEKKNNPFLI